MICLPAFGQDRDDFGERLEVPRVNNFAWGMRIAERPAEWDIHRAIAREDGAVVAAACDAELHGDAVFAREFHHAVDVFARSDVRIVDGANDEAFADFGVGEAF